MKTILLLFLYIFLTNLTYSQPFSSKNFNITESELGYTLQPKQSSFVPDTVNRFETDFPNQDFIVPLRNELTQFLNKEIFGRFRVEGDPLIGFIVLYIDKNGKVIYVDLGIYKSNAHLFNDRIIQKLYKKVEDYKFELPEKKYTRRIPLNVKWPIPEDKDIFTTRYNSSDTFNYTKMILRLKKTVK